MKFESVSENKKKINPIDPDKVAENPHLLPYAHTLGGAIIKPIDQGRSRGLAMSAMYEQTEGQLQQIKSQIELLVSQAQEIHNRISISEMIYEAKYNFKPIHGQSYYLYEDKDEYVLSMISPKEWGTSLKYTFVSEVKMMGDNTWKIIKDEAREI